MNKYIETLVVTMLGDLECINLNVNSSFAPPRPFKKDLFELKFACCNTCNYCKSATVYRGVRAGPADLAIAGSIIILFNQKLYVLLQGRV